MASQNSQQRPPYLPPPPAHGSLPTAMQNLNIGRPPAPPWASAQAPRPGPFAAPSSGSPALPLNQAPPFPNSPSIPRPLPGTIANSAPPIATGGALPTSASAINGVPPGSWAGPPIVGNPLSTQVSMSGAGRDTPYAVARQLPNWAQNNGPSYVEGLTPMQPGGLTRPPVQPQPSGVAAMYTQRPDAQYPWRPPQSQSLASGDQSGFGSATLPPVSAPLSASALPSGPTWPMASTYPPSFGVPPAPRPQAIPGMAAQSAASMPPPPMGISQSASPATVPSSAGTSRIDPSQIPRPQTSSMLVNFETYMNNQAAFPPSATSNFIARDTGNCSPRYMRFSVNQIPCSGDLLSTSGMPLVLMVQPLALPHPSEEPIQVVDFGESGPVRCSRCKGYINPFMKFIDQGRHFKCNFCGHTNDTPRDYQCNLGPDGRRRDADERPELCRGTVEFVASKGYMVRPPMSPVFFFLIDVSMNAILTGATMTACSAVQRALGDLPEGPQTKVGIATFDSTLHFYSFNQALQQPSMLVVPDIQDVYTPLQTGLTVSVSEYRQQMEALLEAIPGMFQGTTNPDSAFGAAIKGAFLAIKSTGGKLLVFQSALPSVGFGALSARDAEAKRGPSTVEKDLNKLLQPVDKTLKTLALELAEFQVCCDLFLTTQGYVDVASLAVVPRTTGGQVYYYYPFVATSDSAKVYNDLRWNLTRPQGLEAVMRVRCSQGLQVHDYAGNFCKRTPTDLDLPAIDCDKTIMVSFKHDDKFQDGSECGFQCALLYTTMYGQRRIRITTLSLSCTTVLSNVFRGADLDTQFTYFLKQAAQDVPTNPAVQVRERMTNLCVNILFAYRKFCATASSSGQLILPEALKLLPLYTLALTKSVGLRADVRTDDRSYWLTRVASISMALAIPTVYPRMFSLHDIASKDIGDDNLPQTLYLSSENLNNEGIFLLETGEDVFIYAGKSVSSDIMSQLFGVQSVNEITSSQFVLQEFPNDASRKLNALVNILRQQRCSYLRFWWCRRGDPLEMVFSSFMVEDKNILGLSYTEFLVHVHRQIQNKMT